MNYLKKKRRRDDFKYPNRSVKNRWDKFSIMLTSGFGIVLLIFFIYMSGLIPSDKLLSNENNPGFKTTSAIVYSFESKEMYQQTKLGNVNTTVAYYVKYRFTIHGVNYDSEERISTILNPKFRLYIQQHLNEDAFSVCYEIANPKNCSLVQKIK